MVVPSDPSTVVGVVHIADPRVHCPFDEHVAPVEQSLDDTHEVLHEAVIVSHAKGAQFLLCAATHDPAPSHACDSASVSPVQLAEVPHAVPAAGYEQASGLPEHTPRQAVPIPMHAARVPIGCELVSGAHVPGLVPAQYEH